MTKGISPRPPMVPVRPAAASPPTPPQVLPPIPMQRPQVGPTVEPTPEMSMAHGVEQLPTDEFVALSLTPDARSTDSSFSLGGGIDLDLDFGAAPSGELDVASLPSISLAPPSAAAAQDDRPGASSAATMGGAPMSRAFGLPSISLAPPSPAGEIDLPMPKPVPKLGASPIADLPALKVQADLPVPKVQADLPVPKVQADLPTPKFDVGLPTPKSGAAGSGFGHEPTRRANNPLAAMELDLPTPKFDVGLPAPKQPDLPTPKQVELPAHKRAAGLAAMSLSPPSFDTGDVTKAYNNDAGSADLSSGFGEIDLPPTTTAWTGGSKPDEDLVLAGEPDLNLVDGPSHQSQDAQDAHGARAGGAGGADYGSLEFAEIPAGGEASIDLQPGGELVDLPEQEGEGTEELARSAKVEQEVKEALQAQAPPPPWWKRRMFWAPVTFVVTVLGFGFSLSFTPYGVFGRYFLERYMPDQGNASEIRKVIDKAETLAAVDTYPAVRQSLKLLGTARNKAGLNRELLARSLLHESLYQIRFGSDVHSESRANAIASRLEERKNQAPGIEIALAAYAIAKGEAGRAANHLRVARAKYPGDPYVYLVEGQAELEKGKTKDAIKAFTQATRIQKAGARALWGLAQARLLDAEDVDAIELAVNATIEESPTHAAALIAKGQIYWQNEKLNAAERFAQWASGRRPLPSGKVVEASLLETARALTLLARVEESRGHWNEARVAYEAALGANPENGWALVGAGRALLREKQFAEALSRFEAVLTREGSEEEETGGVSPINAAKLGSAQAILSLNRVQEAAGVLRELAEEHPDDPEILLWLGRAEAAQGSVESAEAHLKKAIELAPKSFEAYLALSRLMLKNNKKAQAASILAQARKEVEESADMRQLLGDSELEQGNVVEAEREYRRAIELDAGHMAALFGLGVCLRRTDKLDEAAIVFDALARRNALYPGLAMERGLVYENLGRAADAVQSYADALKSRPDDQTLKFRLGAAQFAASQLVEARATLDAVLAKNPNSAEAEYYLGRVELQEGNLNKAEQRFKRACDLDASRAEFHAYLGWAMVEKGALSGALEEARLALQIDSQNAEAYSVRGRVRLRTGAVKDALKDFQESLRLNPKRVEAHAGIGECYDQLRKLPQAIDAYKQALALEEPHGEWWYKLGRVYVDSGKYAEASPCFVRSTQLGDAMRKPPAWLADAHRLNGEVHRKFGRKQEAVQSYQRYLEIAPPSSIDIADVKQQLAELTGVPLEE
jgi:tetratricopeptide (TPR) repeat protein